MLYNVKKVKKVRNDKIKYTRRRFVKKDYEKK